MAGETALQITIKAFAGESGPIKNALENLEIAELRFVAAYNKNITNHDDNTEAVSADATKKYKDAQIDLGLAIKNQAERLARDSSFRGHGLKNCADVRQWEKKILDQVATPDLKSRLARAVHENEGLRATHELIVLSQTTKPLNADQIKEGRHIIADATGGVIGRREGEEDQEVTRNQLNRLETLLKTITTREDSAGQVQKFDRGLYNELTENIKAQMGHLDPNDNRRFEELVTEYRPA